MKFNLAEIELSLVDRFQKIASCFAENIALIDKDNQFTYRQVDTISNQIVSRILHFKGNNNQPIVLFFEHEATVIISILGVLKANKSYVVLDPSLPQERFNIIYGDLQNPLIITNNHHYPLASHIISDRNLIINIDHLDLEDISININYPSIQSNEGALIFYTSGSTGKPKGVQWSHQGILQRIYADTLDYQINECDRIALFYSCSFGASVADIFNALLNGGILCLYDFKTEGLQNLSHWLKQQEITICHLPVDVFRQWIITLDNKDYFPKLRQIIPSGKLYQKDVQRIWQHLPENSVLIQRLSSSEAGMCTRIIIDRKMIFDDLVVPTGYPVSEKEIILLDANNNIIQDDQVGQIAVRSKYLAMGYWRDDKLTTEKFMPDVDNPQLRLYKTGDLGKWNQDGTLQYLERQDFMVKIRGYRVEPSEVETALYSLDIIQQAVVIANSIDESDIYLIAYIIPTQNNSPSYTQLYKCLENIIPNYMIPRYFVMVDSFPLTPNGKIDKKALPIPNFESNRESEFISPRNEIERKLAQILQEVLGIEKIGINDNFFALGGHSLLATQIISRIRTNFLVEFPLRNLFEYPTIAQLGYLLSQMEIMETGEI